MKPTRILIAYDATDSSRDLMVDLRQAGLPEILHADVVSFAGSPLSEPEPALAEIESAVRKPGIHLSAIAELFRRATVLSRRGREQVQSLFPGWSVASQAYATAETWGRMRVARDWYPDLLLFGCDRRAPSGPRTSGSIRGILLRESPCSVRIGRAPFGPRKGGLRIVVAVDGSPDSAAAVSSVAARRWPAGTSAEVVMVVDERIGDDERSIEEYAAGASGALKELGLAARHRFIGGDTATAILEESARRAADMIFIGARNDRFDQGKGIGGVAARVAAEAECSVEVVRGC